MIPSEIGGQTKLNISKVKWILGVKGSWTLTFCMEKYLK